MFPEFSLTGAVDPARHPEHAVARDAEPVRALVAATHRIGVGAVFGIAERAERAEGVERAEDEFFIAQLFAHDGRLRGA